MKKIKYYISDVGLFCDPLKKRRIIKKMFRTSYLIRCAEGLKNSLIFSLKIKEE